METVLKGSGGPKNKKAKWETSPLTAGEMIALLSAYPADTPLILGGDDFGYNLQVEVAYAGINAATSHWNGPHVQRSRSHGQRVLTVSTRHDEPAFSYLEKP